MRWFAIDCELKFEPTFPVQCTNRAALRTDRGDGKYWYPIGCSVF